MPGIFDDHIARILGHEGGFTVNPKDRGNWTSGICGVGRCNGTKYGISAMSYPDTDIKNLTWDQAKALYWKDFWEPLQGGLYPDGVAYQLLDFAINSGMRAAIKAVQRAVKVKDDGDFGPDSRRAMQNIAESDLIFLILAERLEYMTNSSKWDDFGKGWARRIAVNLRFGADDS